MILTTIIFLITITILVTVHEFGHFIVARLCGVKVECFSIGFGKKLCSYTSKNGTEFTIAPIPLGGYVKMLDGRNNSNISEQELKFAFDQKPVFKRVLILIAGPLANFILAFFVFWIAFQIGVIRYPIIIADTIPNTPAASIIIPAQSQLLSINGTNIESWRDANFALISELGNNEVNISYQVDHQRIYHQTIDIKNWQFDIEKQSAIEAFGLVPEKVVVYPIIQKIQSNSAAESAGLTIGDEIVAYNNKKFDNWNNFSALIKTAKPITIEIKRANEIKTVYLEPKQKLDSNGQLIGIAGIFPRNNTIVKQYGIVSALVKAFEQTTVTTKYITKSFYQLITGVFSIKNLSGPVGIAQGAGQSASYGLVSYLFFLAFISISLGIMNLIPLPILDGGQILFLVIEKIKGCPLSNTQQEICYRIGSVLLITILGIALCNDFIRLL